MKRFDSFKIKMEERKKLLRLRDRLLSTAMYQTPGCSGILKGPHGFFEENAIQKVFEDYGIRAVHYTCSD